MFVKPQTKPPVQNFRKNAFDTAEVLKTFEIQQYIGFFVIADYQNSLQPMSDPRISSQCGTIREAGINFKSKEIWRDN